MRFSESTGCENRGHVRLRMNMAASAFLALISPLCYCSDHSSVKITNGVVQANIYLPNSKTGYYHGTRFDWSGIVSDLEYAGHNFYPQWYQTVDPKVHDLTFEGPNIVVGNNTAIVGTPEEFIEPLGFEGSKPGGTFLKIGVGVLRRPDDASYDMLRMYTIVNSGKWRLEKKHNSVRFTQTLADPASGYGYVYRKLVSLTEGRAQMVISHTLQNIGKKAIKTSVYDHNFLFLDGTPPGPDSTVIFPFVLSADPVSGDRFVRVVDNKIIFQKTLSDYDLVLLNLHGFGSDPKGYDFRIENRKAGMGVRVNGDRPLLRESLWAIRAPLAVEPCIDVNIAPGARFTWRIMYDFYKLPQEANRLESH